MEKINFKNISRELTREEMKSVMAGSGSGCPAIVVCPGGERLYCTSSSGGTCVAVEDGCGGFVNCDWGVGFEACWEEDDEC